MLQLGNSGFAQASFFALSGTLYSHLIHFLLEGIHIYTLHICL